MKSPTTAREKAFQLSHKSQENVCPDLSLELALIASANGDRFAVEAALGRRRIGLPRLAERLAIHLLRSRLHLPPTVDPIEVDLIPSSGKPALDAVDALYVAAIHSLSHDRASVDRNLRWARTQLRWLRSGESLRPWILDLIAGGPAFDAFVSAEVAYCNEWLEERARRADPLELDVEAWAARPPLKADPDAVKNALLTVRRSNEALRAIEEIDSREIMSRVAGCLALEAVKYHRIREAIDIAQRCTTDDRLGVFAWILNLSGRADIGN
jgi:hypothetical protein